MNENSVGICYKITDLNTGKFYIGSTKRSQKFIDGTYNGSGKKWVDYYNKHKSAHSFKREILKSNFKTSLEMHSYEANEIKKYCKLIKSKYVVDETTGCMNTDTKNQPEIEPCRECGSKIYHKKSCSQYKPSSIVCLECNGVNGNHKKYCSKYKEKEPCSECGSIGSSHKKVCSKYVLNTKLICNECGGLNNKHRKDCSKVIRCQECGLTHSHHSPECSRYKKAVICPECSGKRNHHKTGCSHRKGYDKKCPHCGNAMGHHKSSCKLYKDPGKCEECGYSLRSNCHAKTCSQYKKPNRNTEAEVIT